MKNCLAVCGDGTILDCQFRKLLRGSFRKLLRATSSQAPVRNPPAFFLSLPLRITACRIHRPNNLGRTLFGLSKKVPRASNCASYPCSPLLHPLINNPFSTIYLGRYSVSSLGRVPNPPHMTTFTCIFYLCTSGFSRTTTRFEKVPSAGKKSNSYLALRETVMNTLFKMPGFGCVCRGSP